MPVEGVQTLRLTTLPSPNTLQTQWHNREEHQVVGTVVVDSSLAGRTTVCPQAEPQLLAILDTSLEAPVPPVLLLAVPVDALPQAVLHKTSLGRHNQRPGQLDDP